MAIRNSSLPWYRRLWALIFIPLVAAPCVLAAASYYLGLPSPTVYTSWDWIIDLANGLSPQYIPVDLMVVALVAGLYMHHKYRLTHPPKAGHSAFPMIFMYIILTAIYAYILAGLSLALVIPAIACDPSCSAGPPHYSWVVNETGGRYIPADIALGIGVIIFMTRILNSRTPRSILTPRQFLTASKRPLRIALMAIALIYSLFAISYVARSVGNGRWQGYYFQPPVTCAEVIYQKYKNATGDYFFPNCTNDSTFSVTYLNAQVRETAYIPLDLPAALLLVGVIGWSLMPRRKAN